MRYLDWITFPNDEPENSLSPGRQQELVAFLVDFPM